MGRSTGRAGGRPTSAQAAGVRTVPGPPSLAPLYARSLLRRPRRAVDFPRTTVRAEGVRPDVERVAAFCRATGFPVRDVLPLPLPHLLGFGLQVDLLVREAFPFRLLGLVHVRQSFEQSAPLPVDAPLDVFVRAVGMRPHQRGATVELLTEVSRAGAAQVVWSGRSRYLARGVRMPGTPVAEDRLPAPEGEGTLWRVPADTGREYAAVSGDVNPIHLSRPTARLLGFRRALAHGVWTASRSLAALGGPAPAAARFEVGFGAPLLLPSTVRHVVREVPGGWETAVRSRDGSTVHLTGRLTHR
ncbi:MaoC/PaaZ C-terminal domain-containing protein [Kineococcus sp. SYSU DK006]|uniref:MaoC/PaaZ C-terminal domain-containing protein n=1 Tax=Kineococcus sp. SYSU DK006 TaxID=3383127 RepID=UPI003D7DD37A